MYCDKCGAPVNEGEAFCGACGNRIGDAEPSAQPVPPYAEQSGPQYGAPVKKSKKALVAVIAVVAALLAAAAVVLFVYPGFLTGAASPGILSGTTPQTRFVNDGANVFKNAFDGFGSDAFERMGNEPFDLILDTTVTSGEVEQKIKLYVAYDNRTLGLSADAGMIALKALLLNDVVYADLFGSVNAIDLESKADFSKPMSLKDRFAAIAEGIKANTAQQQKTPDFKALAEMFVNSIDEKCIKKSAGKSVLTLEKNDMIDTLEKFSKSLGNDQELKKDLDAYLERTGNTQDSVQMIDEAVSGLKKSEKTGKLVWEIGYKDGKPVSDVITFEASGDKMTISFGYTDTKAGKDIDFNVALPGEQPVGGKFNFEKNAAGINYGGSITSSGDTFSFSGNEIWSGSKTRGAIEFTVSGQKITISYDETLKFGMPSTEVDKDSRFSIDTGGARMNKLSDIFRGFAGALPTS